MFSVTVESSFCATHRLRLPDGTLEPLHGHDWGVRAGFRSPNLDALGMVVDFDLARKRLEDALAALHHGNLNEHVAFADRNPTAEEVARYIFERLVGVGLSSVSFVEVTEAPGCAAVFEPGATAALQGPGRD